VQVRLEEIDGQDAVLLGVKQAGLSKAAASREGTR
jgi:hypothetical protein